LVVIGIAAYLQFARCLHDCRPSRDQSHKCFCVPMRIPKPSDQSGLLRTSAISLSCESDVTTLNSSSPQAATTRPGGPFGLRKAEIETLVSSRAASGTAFGLDLGSRLSHFRFNSVLRSRFSTSFHSPQHAFKFVSPPALGVKRDQDAGLLLQPKGPKRFQNTFLIHGSNHLFDRMNFFGQRHKADYTGPS